MGLSDTLYETAGSIRDWAYGGSSASADPVDGTNTAHSRVNGGYWASASSSFQSMIDSSSAAASSLYETFYFNSQTDADATSDANAEHALDRTHPPPPPSPTPRTHRFVGWNLQNPYSNIRGRNQVQPSSLSAVRSLLRVVPLKPTAHGTTADVVPSLERIDTSASSVDSISLSSSMDQQLQSSSGSRPSISRNETASQLAEGTIRALRDLELDEAMELHMSLRYWTLRWERPLLSWIEAGPWVWFSKDGYDHNLVGQRVSQIQAVLARRCAAIGELQQHLLRAGWQKGVAQWGVLGQGGQWANVAGADGAIRTSTSTFSRMDEDSSRRLSAHDSLDPTPLPESSATADKHEWPDNANAPLYYGHSSVLVRKTIGGSIVVDNPALAAWSVDAIRVVRDQLYRASIGLLKLPFEENWKDESTGELIAEGFKRGASQLPIWATRQRNLTPESKLDVEIDTIIEDSEGEVAKKVTLDEVISGTAVQPPETKLQIEEGKIVISDLDVMASEVSELLDTMEVVIEIQRARRLERLKSLPLIRRNWYMAAIGAPLTGYLVYRLLKDGQVANLGRFVVDKVRSFFNEHLYSPVGAILSEFFTRRDRDTISDHKARIDAIESLKKMIESWLEDTYKDVLSDAEIAQRAERMDMSLIEQKKEENMKTIFEINSVVRMSLIEMQFIKKELLSALYAIDEMMTSNEINMNLATVTPAVLLVYLVNRTFRFLFYVLLKVKKSRQETYSSFRHILLDMDRLLLMRDNPPSAPPPLSWTVDGQPTTIAAAPEAPRGPCVLNADDLGMLMLHIHECRTILWEDRSRFSLQTLRDVGEDLAELAGERGPVSVEQQLQVISRMCRTYVFLKVGTKGS